MTEKKTYWVRNASGEYALLDGAAERDRLSAFGWNETDEPPADDAFVWMRHEGIEQPAKFPAKSVANWMANGWVPGAPPEHVDVTQEPSVAQVLGFPASAADSPAPAPAAKASGKTEGK